MKKEEFIKKAQIKQLELFGKIIDYDYSLVPDKLTAKDKIKIICPIHKEKPFEKRVDMFIFGSGCPICGKNSMTTEECIKRAIKTHHNEDGTPKYDYSKTIFTGSEKPITVICHEKDEFGIEHGEFYPPARNHIHSTGCPKCAGNKKLTTETFIHKAQLKHKKPDGTPKYDYSLSVCENGNKSLTIVTCHEKDMFGVEHGDFVVRIDAHLFGQGCPKCSNNSLVSIKEFIIRAHNVQDIRRQKLGLPIYDYSKITEISMTKRIPIICPLHGEFEQIAYNHLYGKEGCPYCLNKNKSILENELYDFIKSIYLGKIIRNTRSILSNNYELDIYIPDKNIAIEFDGLFYHSEDSKPNNYHLMKTQECESKNIHLIHIFEDEWLDKEEIIKSRLKQILGITENKIYARNCKIQTINCNDEKIFFETNHLQGYIPSNICYGLFYQNELVACMSFGPLRKNLGQTNSEIDTYELYRFANKLNTTVIGGASKLFKQFIKSYKPKQIITYADRRYSTLINKTLYDNIGFKFVSSTIPNYFYIKNQKRYNRFNFRKDILVSKYGCPPEKTEHQFCLEQGWYRIYDCGNLKYVWLSEITK